MDLDLTGRRALVTGGNRGIGRAVAARLAAEGVQVALLGRDQESLTQAAAEIGAMVTVSADTTDDAQVRAAVTHAATELGGLDIVVNCAAPRATTAPPPGLDGVDDEDFLRNVDTKALGYLRVVRAAAPHLRNGGGAVVNVSGMNARRSTGSYAGSARNIAVVSISKKLSDELGPQGVSVTCVHPGLTLSERSGNDPAYVEKAAENSLGHAVTADEVADVIVFLTSPRGRIANGAVIELDGGYPGIIWS